MSAACLFSIGGFVGLLAFCTLLVVTMMRRAKTGYEDEKTGFHYGDPPGWGE
jgi:hypothetical protein